MAFLGNQRFRLGLLVNPLAGIGGPLAAKGSDDIELTDGLHYRAFERVKRVLSAFEPITDSLALVVAPSAMGADLVDVNHFQVETLSYPLVWPSTAADTIAIARLMLDQDLDLLLFVGGDGTARNIVTAVGEQIPVLGLPSGVKMHSGVYAVSPEAAAELIIHLVEHQLVNVSLREVRDIDESEFRQGRVKSRFYGELCVPAEGAYVQAVKMGGVEYEPLVLDDIAEHIIETLDEGKLSIVGPGSTTRAILDHLGLPNTLLGIDVLLGRELILSDANEVQLLDLLHQHQGDRQMVVTCIGGQGHVFGRGNQQLSPSVIKAVGKDNITIVATRSKLKALEQRPLLVDTNDAELDRSLKGYFQVVTGYQDAVLYPLC
jgi:predicted polyphosphate/ATP-dependent NAD kinase